MNIWSEQTNKQNQEKQNVNKAKTNKQTKQSLHHQTTSYFCELTVKNRSSRLAFKIQEKITEKKTNAIGLPMFGCFRRQCIQGKKTDTILICKIKQVLKLTFL